MSRSDSSVPLSLTIALASLRAAVGLHLVHSGCFTESHPLLAAAMVLVGAALALGLFGRVCAAISIGLIAAHAPFETVALLESLALVAVLAEPAKEVGIAGLMGRWTRSTASGEWNSATEARRRMLGSLIGAPVVGAAAWAVLKQFGYASFEEENLTEAAEGAAKPKVDAVSGATMRFEWTPLSALDGKPPLAKCVIGDLKISRLILGGNLIGGWAHARDLIYVSKLVKAYHNRRKIFETFALAEKCGVDTIITNPLMCEYINDYWRGRNGKLQFISDCGGANVLELIQKSVDAGACACYIQGGVADDLVARGDFDTIEKGLDLIRKNGIPCGIGGHKLSTIQACVDRGYHPDFWMKTLHQSNYWSATDADETERDNIWCYNADETIAYMESLPQPWIAFKILAAGAIHPQKAFKWAFESGADFICVGMYDFQIVDDVLLALNALGDEKLQQRKRRWLADAPVEESKAV